jgi:non-heme chloroperoxidase
MKGLVQDLQSLTLDNDEFSQVLYTAKHSQLVVMALKVGEGIGSEVNELDQFFRVEEGVGVAVLDGVRTPIRAGFAVVVPAGLKHNIINTGTVPLKLYTLYAPPNLPDQTLHHTRAEADADHRHFEGKTTEPRPLFARSTRTQMPGHARQNASIFVTRDGTQLHYKDWGSGKPVVFSHGWPLNADSWEAQMAFLASNGHRCIAHDRRGHGRSSQPWSGNDMDTYADDLSELLEALDVTDATLIGFSAGGGEVARYIGRHGTKRVAKAALISSIPPLMLKTDANPGGLPMEVFDRMRIKSLADRSELYRELASGPFFGANRPGAKVSQGMMDSFWLQGMRAGHKNTFDCIKAFSETDFTEDLKKFDVPTLVLHGDDDQVVPIGVAAILSSKLIKNATLRIYAGAPHGLTETHKDQLNGDLLGFLRS